MQPSSLPSGTAFAVVIEGEIIQIASRSENTLTVSGLTEKGSRGPKDHGTANHPKGTPIYRTTRRTTSDYGIVIGGQLFPGGGGSRRMVIDSEQIMYDTRVGSTYYTPMRSLAEAHTVNTPIYQAGWTGLTRTQFGTTATTWASGETVTPVSMGSAELWVTD